jgi:alkylated DNA repair dioxygenase AlkB
MRWLASTAFYATKSARQKLYVSDITLEISGKGKLKLEQGAGKLRVIGEVGLLLPNGVRVEQELDIEAFRHWIVSAGMTVALPDPRPVDPHRGHSAPAAAVPTFRIQTDTRIEGLSYVPDFITPEEENEIIRLVDGGTWLDDLKRRVQHYGWKYDYKARKITPSAYLGPIPDWTQGLARRLFEAGLMTQMADQVIINEYLGNQSIASHIDCQNCFQGSIAMISLCESWEMIFRGPGKQVVGKILERRSAQSIDGPARNIWKHEIPKRLHEASGLRHRRVSLTFRKVKPPKP